MPAVVYKTNQRTVWAGLLAAINIPRFENFRGQKDKKYDLITCYKTLVKSPWIVFFRFVSFDLYERPQV